MSRKQLISIIILAVLAAVAYYFASKPASTLPKGLTNFAIRDTASIQKIHLANTFGNQIILKRGNDGFWTVNDTYIAREDAIEMLLSTIRRIKVKGTVSDTKKPNVIKRLASSHILVEIFTDDMEKPEKTYYVGDATLDHMGTYMLLETKDEGKSPEPFVVDDIASNGYLRPRFFTRLEEWRNTALFLHPDLAIDKVAVEFIKAPEKSFTLAYYGDNNLKLFNYQKNEVKEFDKQLAKDYLLQYKRVHVDSYVENKISRFKRDSITKHQPDYRITLTPKDGEIEFITLWKKDVGIEQEDRFGYKVNYDVDLMWGETHKQNFVYAQFFNFDPLLRPIDIFIPEKRAN